MNATGSGFSETVYLAAAEERLSTAFKLLNDGAPDYVMATYLGGVAVECLFHAYRMRADSEDVGKHNLAIQAELGRFYVGMKPELRQEVTGYIGEVVARWQNNHRYRSKDALHRYVVAKRLFIVEGKTTTK